MEEQEFSALVSEAIDLISEQYQEKMANIRFKVEYEPSAKQRRELGLRKCDALFGLYEGVPLPQRGGHVHSIVPDTITIFMQPMLTLYPDRQKLARQIQRTVWHEVAHYFGLNHRQIHARENNLH